MKYLFNLQDNVNEIIREEVQKNNLDERYIDVIKERLDNDDYLWEQLITAIEYSIEAEVNYEKLTK